MSEAQVRSMTKKAERRTFLRERGWRNVGSTWFHRRYGWISREFGDSWYYVPHTLAGAFHCELRNPTPVEDREPLKVADVLADAESGCRLELAWEDPPPPMRHSGPWQVTRIYWNGLGVTTKPLSEVAAATCGHEYAHTL